MKIARPAFALALTLVYMSAGAAHYQWRDANGRMVFSDRPPPSHVKPAQILRQPPNLPTAAEAARGIVSAPPPRGAAKSLPSGVAGAGTAGQAPKAGAANATGGDTIAERDAEFRKRRTEQLEAEAKAQETAKLAQKKTSACNDMRTSLRNLESGVRVSRVDEKGARSYLGDTERVQRTGEMRRAVADDCN